jgi:hypothetical protein
MKNIFFFLFTLFCLQVSGQNKDAIKYASLITGDNLKKHLSVIASEEMQGRETGTEGQRKAAAYIEAQFKSIGLKTAQGMKGYQQYYPLYQDSLLNATLEIGKLNAVYGTDYVIQGNNNESVDLKNNKIVFAGYGIEDKNYNDYASIDVKGKVVVMFLGEPKQDGKYIVTGTDRNSTWTFPGLTKKLALAASKGAALVLIINPMQPIFNERVTEASKKTNVYFPRKTGDLLNYALIAHAYFKVIMGANADSSIAYAKRSRPFVQNELFEKTAEINFKYEKKRTVIEASNVIGIIEGTDKKDEYVFLTGHYDHLGMRDGKIYYGADDDGSGTVAVIQMAEAFTKAKAAGKGPRRTLVFMTVSGEEKGLWGSEYYSDNPVYPLEKTSVDLNTDMVGRIDTERHTGDTLNYVYVVGHDKLSSDLPVINEGVNKQYTNLALDYKFDDPNDPNRIYFRSDHYNFARKGIPVLFFYDGMLKADYHRPTDTIDKINWPLYETRVRMIFHTAWEMANRDEMLKRDIPLPESASRR